LSEALWKEAMAMITDKEAVTALVTMAILMTVFYAMIFIAGGMIK